MSSGKHGPGCLITLEGIEGVGKSSSMQYIASLLSQAGKDVVLTREPGGVPAAERIREVLLEGAADALPPRCELLLMFAARTAHLEQLIWPAMRRGQWVVCDRFTDASYAYQGGGRGLPDSDIAVLEKLVHGGFEPALTLLLDASWEATRERRDRRAAQDRFESENGEFFARVRAAYLERARRYPRRFRIIDASRPVTDVRRDIAAAMAELLAREAAP